VEILEGRQVFAPSTWARDTEVLVATVRCDRAPAAATIATLADRLDAVLPERRELFGPFAASADGAWPRLLGEVALALQTAARRPATTLLRLAPTTEPGTCRLVIEAHDPQLATACLNESRAVLEAALAGDLPPLAPLRDRLIALADEVCVGPGTMLIVRAAAVGRECMVQLGQGARQRRIWTAVTDRTSAIAEGIAVNKQLTKDVLAAAGVPVPLGRVVSSATEAWEAAQAVGLPVVVKPADGNHGRGVFLNLASREEVERAFPVAAAEGRRVKTVVVEQFVPGVEHRLLVIGGRLAACAKGEHIYVAGDGRHTIAALIDLQINSDPRRGRSEASPNKLVELDATVLAQLAQEGVAADTVPAEGRRVLVKQIGTHGLDVTEHVHPEMAALAVRAARAVGLDIAGIDLLARDIDRPPLEQGAAVCEVNAGPQLMIHAHPSSGPGQPVADLIVDLLCATAAPGRIPVAVMPTAGSDPSSPETTTAQALEQRLRAAGKSPGLTCTAGRWLAGMHCATEAAETTASARDLFVAPDIDTAVLAVDWRSLAASGLPVDHCDVLLLGPLPAATPAEIDALAGVTPTAVVETLLATVAPSGTVILIAADAATAALATASGRTVLHVERHQAAEAAADALLGR
jgi:cyanophycin synthetase